jgi:hypothetical protein
LTRLKNYVQHHSAYSPFVCDRLGFQLQRVQPHHTSVTSLPDPPPSPLPILPPSLLAKVPLAVTAIGDSMLPMPFYLADVLIAPNLIQSLLSIPRVSTDNFSMQFDAFGLFVKDLAKRSVIARYNSYGSLYSLRLPASTTSTIDVVLYALVVVVASSSTWHRRLGHPSPDVLMKLSRSSVITCLRATDDSMCHACHS